jgi:hypothetical protein
MATSLTPRTPPCHNRRRNRWSNRKNSIRQLTQKRRRRYLTTRPGPVCMPYLILPSNTSTPTSTSNPTALNTVFQRTIAVLTTGCAPDSNFLKALPYSFSSNSTHLSIPYTTFRDELFALSAATTSDCIEACVMSNSYRKDEDRWCIGGGFSQTGGIRARLWMRVAGCRIIAF